MSSALASGFLTTGPPEKGPIFFFILFSMLVYHWTLNIVPCAVQQDLVVCPFYTFGTFFFFNLGAGLIAKSCPTLTTPWTVACQAPLSMGFSRQGYWSGLPFPSPGDPPDPGIEPRFPAL